MPVNTRQKCYDTKITSATARVLNNDRCPSPIRRVNVQKSKYQGASSNGIEKSQNQVFNKSSNDRCPSPTLRVYVGNCKYRRVLIENIERVDRGRNKIFSPLGIKDRLRSASRKVFDPIML